MKNSMLCPFSINQPSGCMISRSFAESGAAPGHRASANCARYCGASANFVDIDPQDPDQRHEKRRRSDHAITAAFFLAQPVFDRFEVEPSHNHSDLVDFVVEREEGGKVKAELFPDISIGDAPVTAGEGAS